MLCHLLYSYLDGELHMSCFLVSRWRCMHRHTMTLIRWTHMVCKQACSAGVLESMQRQQQRHLQKHRMLHHCCIAVDGSSMCVALQGPAGNTHGFFQLSRRQCVEVWWQGS